MIDFCALGELAEIDISGVDKKIKESEFKVKLCNYVDVYYNWAISKKNESKFMIASANKNEIDRFTIKKGYVAITKDSETRDDIGVSTYIAEDFENTLLGYHCALIMPHKEKLNGKYLNAFLHTEFAQKHFSNNASGSGQRYTLTIDAIKSLKIPMISLEKQEKIGELFSYIDRKIENNDESNAYFEKILKTIYDYWFVQFDFPDKNGMPYQSTGGKMVWNGELKREIPKGWKVKEILDVCSIVDCLHSKKPEYRFEKEECFLLTLENITEEGYIDISNKYYISEADYKEWTKKITVLENDFVITNAGRAGDIGRIPKGIKCAIGRNMTAVRTKSINPYYLRQFFKSNYITEQIMKNLDCGAFFKSFNVKSIKKLAIIVSDDSVMEKFLEYAEPIIKEIDRKNNESSELTSLREFLLPVLISGQVGFKEYQ